MNSRDNAIARRRVMETSDAIECSPCLRKESQQLLEFLNCGSFMSRGKRGTPGPSDGAVMGW
jgi:hypothetical protein